MAVVLIGCSKDDNGGDTSASLIGTWKLTAEKMNGTALELDVCDLRSTVMFTATTFKTMEYEGDNCATVTEIDGTYTLNGTTLKITNINGVETLEVSKLTATIFETTETDEGDVYVTTFTRQ